MGKPEFRKFKDEYSDFKLQANKILANANAVFDTDTRALPNSGKVYDLFDSTNDYSCGKLDTTSTTLTSAYSAGVSVVAVASVTGFVAGMEVTVYDDVGSESITILSVGALQLTFATNTVNGYKSGAGVARSNVVISGGKMNFGSASIGSSGSFNYPSGVSIDAAGKIGAGQNSFIVKNNAYFFKVYRDGTIIKVARSANLTSWTSFTVADMSPYNPTDPCIDVDSAGNLHVVFNSFDATNTGFLQVKYCKSTDNAATWSAWTNIALISGYDQGNYPSIHVDKYDYLHVSWVGFDSSSDDNLVKYTRSINGGTSWSAYSNLTTSLAVQSGGVYGSYAYITSGATGTLHLVYESYAGNPNTGKYYKRSTNSGVSWGSQITINYVASYSGGPFHRAIVTATGKVIVYWSQWNGTQDQAQCKSSTDDGVSWGALQQIQPNSSYNFDDMKMCASATEVYVFCCGYSPASASYYNLKYSKSTDDGVTWSAWTNITNSTTAHVFYNFPTQKFTNFTMALAMYNLGGVSYLSGVATYGGSVSYPLLTSIARYNITPSLPTFGDMAMWVQHDRATPDSNFTVTGALSVNDSASPESYSAMTQTTTNLSAGTAEEQLLNSVATPRNDGCLKITMTRANTGISPTITKILGAID